MQPKRLTTLEKRGLRTWTTFFVLAIGLPFLLYLGYFFGWWGQHSLLLQYLLQCSCPAASIETRYPPSVDVIVPACRYVISMHSPSGRMLYVQEESSNYLLDLQTAQKTPFTL